MSDWIEMTKQEAVAKHRKLWNEIADMIDRGERYGVIDLKREALNNLGEENDIYNNCYCCEYARMYCSNCPVVWNNEDSRCRFMCETGSYEYDENNSEWLNFMYAIKDGYYDLAAKVAREIANLPEKRG